MNYRIIDKVLHIFLMPRSFKPPNNLGEYFMRYTVYMRVEFVFFIIPNLWARSHRPPTQYNLRSTTDTTMYSDSLAAVSKIMRTLELLPEKLGVYSVWLIQAVNYRWGVPGLSQRYAAMFQRKSRRSGTRIRLCLTSRCTYGSTEYVTKKYVSDSD